MKFPIFSRRERLWMPPSCPGFGHQSTAGACGNNFRFWKTIWHLATDDTKSLAPSTGSAIRYGRAPSREERAQIDFLLKRDE